MEIKLPYKWIQEYIHTALTAEEFARTLSLHGPSIERWNYNQELNDNILEIEVTSNRVDVASVIGIAREASAILKQDFLWGKPRPSLEIKELKSLTVNVALPDRCPRFQSIVINGITVKESPEWLKNRLKSAGINSINNIVDITNYVLLEYGQPMHAFDYSKVEGKQINVRLAKNGEKIITLVSKEEIELTEEDLIIADSNSPLSIAGVVGGEKSSIKPETKTIILEAANFNAIKTRKTARRHGLRTDASALFEKDLPEEQTEIAILRAIELVNELAGGEVASQLFDIRVVLPVETIIDYPLSLTKNILGIEISVEDTIDVLTRLGFACNLENNLLHVKVPYYRAKDVKLDYDLAEEIARMYGYHKIPSKLMTTQIPIVKTATIISNEDKTKDILANNGFTETISYSLISDKYLSISNLNPADVIVINNPLNEDYKYLRKDLASTMLINAKQNEALVENLKLFELSNVYIKVDDKTLPIEQSTLSIVINSNDYKNAFYLLKGIWELILKTHGINLENVIYKNESVKEPFSIGKSANIYFNNDCIGTIGIASKNAQKTLGLKKETAILEVNFSKLSDIIDNTIVSYMPISKYPSATRDLAFVIDKSVEWQEIKELVKSKTGDLLKDIELFDMFEDTKIGSNKKSIAFHITLQSKEKTLEDNVINSLIDSISEAIVQKYNAVPRV